ncbi:MAG: hypothetical protein LUC20_07430 [Oscillospiraceae bacterium]|nr:hypothetical protein [Oscillospiraceae bacterium]
MSQTKFIIKRKPANKKSSPKQDLTKGNFAGSRLRKEHDKKAAAKAPT